MEKIECIVAGAGVIGLAIARTLAQMGIETLIIEAEKAIGTHSSSRSNEVMHAGFLYAPVTLKSRLCRYGQELLYEYCKSHNIPFHLTGKLVISTCEAETAELRKLMSFADANKIADVEFIEGKHICELEPDLRCAAAISSPSTGVVDSHALLFALLGDAESAGATLALRSKVTSVRRDYRGFRVGVESADENWSELKCDLLVNAAGLGALPIARDLLGHSAPQVRFAKGNFFSYLARKPFSRLIVPVGETLTGGGAFTFDIGGRGKFGPDVEWVETADYSVNVERLSSVIETIRRYFPGISPEVLQPDFAGIRPRVFCDDRGWDWIVDGPSRHGINGFINLLGIDTPGLTARLSLASYVGELVKKEAMIDHVEL